MSNDKYGKFDYKTHDKYKKTDYKSYNKKSDYRKNIPQMEYKELTNNPNDNYVDYAQSVIRHLNSLGDNLLSTSQIRNLLSLNSEIYNMVIIDNQKTLSENVKAKLQYLKVRMVYDSGRDDKVKAFVLNSHLIDHINWIGDSKERYMLFSKYMEALVAYRKFEGKGKDS